MSIKNVLNKDQKTKVLHCHNQGLRPIDISSQLNLAYVDVLYFLESHQLIKAPFRMNLVYSQAARGDEKLIELVGFCVPLKHHIALPLTHKEIRDILKSSANDSLENVTNFYRTAS